MLLCQGTNVGDWTFYLKDRRLHYAPNYSRRALYSVSSTEGVREGRTSRASNSNPPGSRTSPTARACRAAT
ncbi:hypothetical protein [Streptomyces sviceus]|uniref:hypothetical protein n=1 Tax=Streptomyces sviceus TaxID=285530 RepID=UPI00332D96BC